MSDTHHWTLEDWVKEQPSPSPETPPSPQPTSTPILTNSQADIHADRAKLTYGRERYEGFSVGKYLQTPPLLFTRDGHALYLGDMYRGTSAFLLLSGPSTKQLDLSLLRQPGVLSMSVNNAVSSCKTNLWTCVDGPEKFVKSAWFDPTILKMVPYCYAEKTIYDNELQKETNIRVGDCPSTIFYRRNEHFVARQFLFENTVNWGNHSNLCTCGNWRKDLRRSEVKELICSKCGKKEWGARSVMLAALRLLFYMGVRNVFLLGCDFHMEPDQENYHFEQDRSRAAVKSNNTTYRMLTRRFAELRPIFEKNHFFIFNCNPESNLDVFPKVDYLEAVQAVRSPFPEKDRTAGLYERKPHG